MLMGIHIIKTSIVFKVFLKNKHVLFFYLLISLNNSTCVKFIGGEWDAFLKLTQEDFLAQHSICLHGVS